MPRSWLVVCGLLVSQVAFPFPEMVRHGYVNCTSCHVSPNGEGVLTAYGRGLSEEVLSTWRREGESAFAYGLIKPPDWLSLGGDFRALQLYRDTPALREQRLIWMQADLEAAATYKEFHAAATLGWQDLPSPTKWTQEVISRRHYLVYRPLEKLSLRAGRFQRSFGINLADHIVVTKRGLGLDQGQETYNLETAWLGDEWDFFGTILVGRPDSPSDQREKGVALRSSASFAEKHKVGLSYFYGGNDIASRHLYGPYFILGFTPHFFALAEIDFQNSIVKATNTSSFGFVNYLRLNYEFIQGLHVFATQELARLDLKSNARWADIYGVGLQWFPRPHLEFQTMFQKQKMPGLSAEFIDMAWIMVHFYP